MAHPRDLRLLAGAVLLSALGDFVALIALALHVHALTGSAFAVSALFATTMVPAVLLAPVAGLVADRVESVRVLVAASLAQAVVGAALAFCADLPAVLALSALLAAGSTLSQPAEFALVPAAAGARPLAEANGLMEAARYAGFTAGPLVGGALVAVGDTRLALLANAATFVAVAAAGVLLRVRRPPGAPPVAGDRARDGAVALWRDRPLRIVVGACTASLLLVSAVMTIEVFYVKDVLHAGDSGYALVIAAWTLGMVGGALRVARRVPPRAAAGAALLALAVQGAGLAGQVAWAALPAALVGYLVGGLGHGVKNTLVRTLIQQRVPERVHGRAFAAYSAARNAAELAALGAGGVLVGTVGPRLGLLIAGSAPVLAGVAGLAALRRVRHPERTRGPDPPSRSLPRRARRGDRERQEPLGGAVVPPGPRRLVGPAARRRRAR
jgi:MFS family permease